MHAYLCGVRLLWLVLKIESTESMAATNKFADKQPCGQAKQ